MRKRKRKGTLWIFCIFEVAVCLVCLVLDLVPQSYCCKAVENIFNYDMSGMVTATVAIWGFTTAAIIFFMGRRTEKTYGICPVDVLKYKGKEIIARYVVFWISVEFFLFVIAAMYKWKITGMALMVFSFLIMLYLFDLIQQVTLPENAVQFTMEELKEVLHSAGEQVDLSQERYKQLLLMRMIRHMNYQDSDAAEQLVLVLEKCVFRRAQGKWGRKNCQLCIEKVIEFCGDSLNRDRIIKNLVTSSTSDAKKGIIAALVLKLDGNDQVYHLLQDVLGMIQDAKEAASLKVWYLQYLEYLTGHVGYEWVRILQQEIDESDIDSENPETLAMMQIYEEEIEEDYEGR